MYHPIIELSFFRGGMLYRAKKTDCGAWSIEIGDRSAGAMRGRAAMIIPALGLVGLLAGCAIGPKPLYYWGNDQIVMYRVQPQPGSLDAATAIKRLSANIAKAQAKGLAVPPGEHAELGYLQYRAGDFAQAAAQFHAEARLFPSSGPFMQRLLAKLSHQPRTYRAVRS